MHLFYFEKKEVRNVHEQQYHDKYNELRHKLYADGEGECSDYSTFVFFWGVFYSSFFQGFKRISGHRQKPVSHEVSKRWSVVGNEIAIVY